MTSTDRHTVVRGLWLASLLFLALASTAGAALQPTHLRAEYLENPEGLGTPHPRLSWQLESRERRQHQTAYHIQVASRPDLLKSDTPDLWDSGRVATEVTSQIPYSGKALASGSTAFWKVRVWDARNRASSWSPVAHWSLGLLHPEDWTAEWITHADPSPVPTRSDTLHLPPARHYRRTFDITKPILRARLHASALGIVDFHANGHLLGDAYFQPGWNDYLLRAPTRTLDVTPHLRAGPNCLGAVLADGWYAGYVGYGLLVGYGPNKSGRAFYGKTPALLAQLEIEYADGSRERIVTDRSWKVSADGPFREADLIMGEAFDARRERPDWCAAHGQGAADWAWEPVRLAADMGSIPATSHDNRGPRAVDLGFRPPQRLQPYAAPPIRVTEELRAKPLPSPAAGQHLYDLGQNIAGIIRLRVKGPAGTRVQIRYGEMLHTDGRLMTENLRRARAIDFVTLRGDPAGETWSPRFTYHGFRYVELSGLPEAPAPDAVTGLVLHNDTPFTGSFACSDDLMTRFWLNTRWTQRANFIEIPTDCPQRDERLGWMGDAQAYIRAATYNADVAAFFTKWLDDVAEAQRDHGAYPDYAPYPMGHGNPGQTWGTAWTDAGIICPWTVWKVYGDTRLLERLWPSMSRFLEFRRQRAPDLRGRSDGNTWGDWLNVNEPTPLELVDAAYFKLSASLMAEMAEALGRTDEARQYRDLAAAIAAKFREDYLQPDGTLKVATQTAHVLALAFDLLTPELVAPTADRLVARIEANGTRMTTGFLGTRDILPALTRAGKHDTALRLFQSRRFPSWGYEMVNGATTVWERWDSFTREHGFNGAAGDQNASMNSFSHYAFGAITAWMFRDLAGIDTDGPGFRQLTLRPGPPSAAAFQHPDPHGVPPLTWVRARYHSPHGPITAAWRTDGRRFEYDVSLPANTSATVWMPAAAAAQVRERGRPVLRHRDVRVVGQEHGRVGLAIGSGTYRFVAQP